MGDAVSCWLRLLYAASCQASAMQSLPIARAHTGLPRTQHLTCIVGSAVSYIAWMQAKAYVSHGCYALYVPIDLQLPLLPSLAPPGRPRQAVPAGEHCCEPCSCAEQQRWRQQCSGSRCRSSSWWWQQLAGSCVCCVVQRPRGPQPQGGTDHTVSALCESKFISCEDYVMLGYLV